MFSVWFVIKMNVIAFRKNMVVMTFISWAAIKVPDCSALSRRERNIFHADLSHLLRHVNYRFCGTVIKLEGKFCYNLGGCVNVKSIYTKKSHEYEYERIQHFVTWCFNYLLGGLISSQYKPDTYDHEIRILRFFFSFTTFLFLWNSRVGHPRENPTILDLRQLNGHAGPTRKQNGFECSS